MNFKGTLPTLIPEALIHEPSQVESYDGVEKGRTRRYYRITKSGRATLMRDCAEWRALSRAVTMILGEA